MLPFYLFGSLQPCAVAFGSGVVHSSCSDEAAPRMTDREETGLERAKQETPSIYRQRQNEREKKVQTELIRGPEVRRRMRWKNGKSRMCGSLV